MKSENLCQKTILIKHGQPHSQKLKLNSYVIWMRSKWGSKLTYFSNFVIYYLLVQLRVKSRLKRRVVKWVYFHSQPFSNRLNWHDDTFYTYLLDLLHLLFTLFTLTFYTNFLHLLFTLTFYTNFLHLHFTLFTLTFYTFTLTFYTYILHFLH